MSDGSLSQEEIDALLQGADDLGATIEPETSISTGVLTEEEKVEMSALASEIAASMGTTLSTITGKTAGISNPNVEPSVCSSVTCGARNAGAPWIGFVRVPPPY